MEAKGLAHEVFTYEAEDGVIDAVGVAEKLGFDPASFFLRPSWPGRNGTCTSTASPETRSWI